MERMTPPIVPEEPPAILRNEELKAILDACAGADFDARRDTAIVRLLLDAGMRRGELAGLKRDDIDMDQQVARASPGPQAGCPDHRSPSRQRQVRAAPQSSARASDPTAQRPPRPAVDRRTDELRRGLR
jgi:integrase